MGKVEKATEYMLSVAVDNSHGYDQIYRWGERGDYDCSSLVITAWERAGVPVKTKGASYTGNMLSVFQSCGFTDVTSKINLSTGSGLKYGDVLLNTAVHTAMSLGDGRIVHASGNESGGITGGKPGDQTGGEICVRSYYNRPWTNVLRYVAEEAPTTPATPPASNVGTCTVALKQFVQGNADPQIKTIQRILNGRGYMGKDKHPLIVDGELGTHTAYAIEQFQKTCGMSGINFGTVAGLTWTALLTK